MMKHEVLEKNSGLLLLFTLVVISIGGLIEIVPLFYINDTIEEVKKEIVVQVRDSNGKVVKDENNKNKTETFIVDAIRPYTPLELLGRDVYIKEGCYNCHSQMIRPMQDEHQRYGHYSLAAESKFDHPFQWGSKRTGPDLARVGVKNFPNSWHVRHLISPRSEVPQSIMPNYPWLAKNELDYKNVKDHLRALRYTGVPYSKDDAEYQANIIRFGKQVADVLVIDNAIENLEAQAKRGNYDGDSSKITEMDAIVAYLQMLGTLVDFSKFKEGHFSKFRSAE
ncbi:cytochrome c oxidase, cbb3-type subunit II [Gammaproteobacteria bacterium]|nr:cytochrome c oxidase, cbb3-type subunit II [Gammaproteobacteria bacterium]